MIVRGLNRGYHYRLPSKEKPFNMRRFLIGLGVFAVVTIVTTVLIVMWYKRACAEELMAKATESFAKARETASTAEVVIENNQFIMTGEDEIYPLQKVIIDNREELDEIEKAMVPIVDLMTAGEHDKVREALGAETSPIKRSQRCEASIRVGVIGYCNAKRNNRDMVVFNEWFLKARLKKPINVGERPEELKELPDNLFAMIPTLDKDLSEFPNLKNSLGANLIAHRGELDHVLKFGKTDAVKKRAQDLYNDALVRYSRTEAENDALSVFYRAEKHDGKYSVEDYKKLLEAQAVPVNDINQGDVSLKKLTAYLNELHEQYFVYVSSHRKTEKSFRHTRSISRINSEGELESDRESYYTDGYEFFYVLTTVTPNSRRSESVRVGELDEDDSIGFLSSLQWDYKQNEKVGWVREWKRLHEDRSTIVRGWKKDLNPVIEKE